MAPGIAVVTDSTSRIPADLAAERGILVVPVEVVVNGLAYSEGVDISASAIASALMAGEDVSTSRPSPRRFVEAYREAAQRGAVGIVSAHLSSDLSGTYQSAVLASDESPIPVQVVDSRSVSMGFGYAVLTGAEVAAAGGSSHDVTSAIIARSAVSDVLLYVDTLEYLRRGGRIGAAATLLGNALRVKPILTLLDGTVAPLEKARTTSKALARLFEIAVERAGPGDVDICVQYLDTPQRARELAERLASRIPAARVTTGSLGAVVGCHVGPGAIAVIVAPRPT